MMKINSTIFLKFSCCMISNDSTVIWCLLVPQTNFWVSRFADRKEGHALCNIEEDRRNDWSMIFVQYDFCIVVKMNYLDYSARKVILWYHLWFHKKRKQDFICVMNISNQLFLWPRPKHIVCMFYYGKTREK